MQVQFTTRAWNMRGGKIYIIADDNVAPPKLKTNVKSLTKIAKAVTTDSNIIVVILLAKFDDNHDDDVDGVEDGFVCC